jgi:mannose-1-phosphate guanylyltransferase/mannose-6-phosphate isomerase
MNFVILCGGTGSRLWPKSRNNLPKQFLKLTNEYTMLQNTILRITLLKDLPDKKIVLLCNKEHTHIIKTQINELSIDIKPVIISEPKGCDSAPAICIASLFNTENKCSIVLPSDHIMDQDTFQHCIMEATTLMDQSIVTFGIKPLYAEIGYGYIKTNSTGETLHFVEKPDIHNAIKYIEDGNYLWNSGMFAFKNKHMVDCFRRYANDIFEVCKKTLEYTDKKKPEIDLNPIYYNTCRCISIDYAIMEHLCSDKKAIVGKKTVLYDGYWNDVGTFASMDKELEMEKDSNNNILKGDVVSLDTTNCYIESQDRLITTIHVHNMIIVDTDDAILICNKNNTQDVKKIVDTLKYKKREEVASHKKVFRPWGWYHTIYGNDTSGHKVKTITVYPGEKLSLQSHNHRSEHWVIVKGEAKATLGSKTIFLYKGDHIYIPIREMHRIENIGTEYLEFTETQIGDFLGESDIIRYEDVYGRV